LAAAKEKDIDHCRRSRPDTGAAALQKSLLKTPAPRRPTPTQLAAKNAPLKLKFVRVQITLIKKHF